METLANTPRRRLVAALLPSNVTADLMRVQDEIFRRTGAVSSRALPPLVPLAWADVDVDSIDPSLCPNSPRCTAYRCSGGIIGASLVWRTGGSSTFRSGIGTGAPPPAAPFPAGDYVYLATVEKLPREVLSDLPTLPAGEMSTHRLSCLELTWEVGSEGLHRVTYRIVTERWIKRR